MFLSTEGGIVKEMQNAGKDHNHLVTNRPDRARGRPRVRAFNAMLKAIVSNLTRGSREVRGVRTLEQLTEVEQLFTLREWIKSCRHLPTYARPGQAPKTRVIFATERHIVYG